MDILILSINMLNWLNFDIFIYLKQMVYCYTYELIGYVFNGWI